jgi:hypothetical protein
MKEIQLTQGKVALIDDKDYEKVSQFKWHAAKYSGHWYAYTNITLPDGRYTLQAMHRLIMGLHYGDPSYVDHKNRKQTLDNRRNNLRIATNAENQRNRGKQRNNTSGYKGVVWYKLSCKWRTQIEHHGKKLHGGDFDCPVAAAAMYNWMARLLHGEFAVLNDLSNVTVAALGTGLGAMKTKTSVRNKHSGFIGVSKHKATGKWRPQLWHQGKKFGGGFFADPVRAAKRYDEMALQYRGYSTALNFPDAAA